MRVLVVEDHPRLAQTVATVLRREGMAVDVAFDGREALARTSLTTYDVVILDRDLPVVHGDDVCRSLAADGYPGAVLMLTAARTLEDRVKGLRIGADDYLPKPFHLAELIARVFALARRSRRPLPPTLVHGDLELDSARRRVSRAGQPVALGRKEFAVLELLLGAQGAVVSTEELLERAWDDAVDPFTNVVPMTVSRLRAKLGDPQVIRDRHPGRLSDRWRGVILRELPARLRHPQTTVRWRLTMLYGGLFLVCGATLLAITYTLVAHATTTPPHANFSGAVKFRGAPPRFAWAGAGQRPAQITVPPQVARALRSHAGKVVVGAVVQGQRISDLHQLEIWSAIALAIMAVNSGVLGWLVAGRVLGPVRTITATAQQISEANLHQRLAMPGPRDELRRLADTIDALLERLQGAFDAQRRFVANASHELRTPLTAARALLEMAISDPDATVETFRETCKHALEEGEQQEQLIDALLALAQGQSGIEQREPIELATLTGGVVQAHEPDAAAAGLELDVSLRPAVIAGDRRLIERLVSNLVENAIRHNAPQGQVWARVEERAGQAIVAITNTGPLVPVEEVERLLQPFQRHSPDRVGHHDGLGLGLSIVAAIATAHDAALDIAPVKRGGLQVEVSFPPAADSNPHAEPNDSRPAPRGQTAPAAHNT